MQRQKPSLSANAEFSDDFPRLIQYHASCETDIENKLIQDIDFEYETIPRLHFHSVLFERCHFTESTFEKVEFVDTAFRFCDFSNATLEGSYFNRCDFVSCKGIGINLFHAFWQNIGVSDSNFQYANFTDGKFRNVQISDSDFKNTELENCSFKSTEFANVNLEKANFFKTLLKGIDLTQCNIANIGVSSHELYGAIVNSMQAAELARLLGLVVV